MGQGLTSEMVQWQKVGRRMREAYLRAAELKSEAAAEEAAGIPPGGGSKQALYEAALQHSRQLTAEYVVIANRLAARDLGQPLPKKPKPTPTWEEVLAGLTKAEPGTPAGSGSPVCAQRGSSSGEAAAPAGEVDLSEVALLLPKGAGPSAPSLRRRPGHSEAPS